MTLAAKPFAAVVNHLLARESWARERLAPYAGKTARLVGGRIELFLLVQPQGYLSTVTQDEAQQVDVTIALPAEALPVLLQGGQAAAMKHVKIEGDAEFATVIAHLAEHLRWEPEEDLARVLGDGPAWRIATLARSVDRRARQAGRNLLETVTEYLLEENPQLVGRAALDTFNAELAQVRDTLSRADKRIERLERVLEARQASASHPSAALRRTR
ncbi:ubiquinone biosynthesis accessory factor UbiJ [Paraburkholderia hayleyella]|uniref:ubiquinone biosynthesis accessory factor UbiJ n=1 Tax=Paraburkholderia hayleyella TaxID=2152889 RepID=UPI001290FC99|nr:SCP2 sterol-binding domain-containing protein [Paraburkholderia hayleyella]